MEEIICYKMVGVILRFKIKWYNEGERNIKYFYSLEKCYFNCKIISNFKIENNIRIFKDVEIFQEVKIFYEFFYFFKIDLSMSNEKEDFFFLENNNIKLNYN